MNINFDSKRRFKINGRKYSSADQVPDSVPSVGERTMKHADGQRMTTTATSKIVFNGVEYENIDDMPTYARNLYEQTMDSARKQDNELNGRAVHAARPNPTTAEASFSVRSLILSLLLGGIFLLIYYFYHANP